MSTAAAPGSSQVLSALEPDEADLEEVRSLDNPELLITRAEQSAHEELQASTHALRTLEAARRQVCLDTINESQ
jgi:hypothetical protein